MLLLLVCNAHNFILTLSLRVQYLELMTWKHKKLWVSQTIFNQKTWEIPTTLFPCTKLLRWGHYSRWLTTFDLNYIDDMLVIKIATLCEYLDISFIFITTHLCVTHNSIIYLVNTLTINYHFNLIHYSLE